jgi:hypothetical protein
VEYDGVDRNILDNIIHLLNTAPLGKQSQLARKANELWDLKNTWKQWHSNLEYFPILVLADSEKFKWPQFEMNLHELALVSS